MSEYHFWSPFHGGCIVIFSALIPSVDDGAPYDGTVETAAWLGWGRKRGSRDVFIKSLVAGLVYLQLMGYEALKNDLTLCAFIC
jgi:hypothetical protein